MSRGLVDPLIAEVAAVADPAFVVAVVPLPPLHVVAARVVGGALSFLHHTPA
ncbi:hypothetical protein [Blastococcus mobilis]|uniref:hypothetical protein n=1 Tax=Blastococcus mobilis TaxID=1938746 RepID=UPI001596234A|nr:hypothetical protein [Blastococcus mobilis]